MSYKMHKPHGKRVKNTNRPYGEIAMTCSHMILYIIIIIILLMHHHDFLPCYYDDDFIA